MKYFHCLPPKANKSNIWKKTVHTTLTNTSMSFEFFWLTSVVFFVCFTTKSLWLSHLQLQNVTISSFIYYSNTNFSYFFSIFFADKWYEKRVFFYFFLQKLWTLWNFVSLGENSNYLKLNGHWCLIQVSGLKVGCIS